MWKIKIKLRNKYNKMKFKLYIWLGYKYINYYEILKKYDEFCI